MENVHGRTDIELEGLVCRNGACRVWSALKGGVAGALTFSIFQSITGLLLNLGAFHQIRMFAAAIVGPIALQGWHPLTVFIPVGFVAMLVLFIVSTLLFQVVLEYVPWSINTQGKLICSATAYGLAVWMTSNYVIAPFFGWTWFLRNESTFLQGAVAYAIFYGSTMGLVLIRTRRGGLPEE